MTRETAAPSLKLLLLADEPRFDFPIPPRGQARRRLPPKAKADDFRPKE